MKLLSIPRALLFCACLCVPWSDAAAQFIYTPQFDSPGFVYATAMQSDGKVIAAGTFNSVDSTTRNNIARLLTTGALDTGFNPNANGSVNHAIVQDDDKVLIVGGFTTIGGTSRNSVARLNADGTLDTSFAPTFNNAVSCAALQPDGKVLVGGQFTSVNGTARNRMARLNSDGTLDTGFDPNLNGYVEFITVRSDGKILISGNFGTVGGATKLYFARLDSGGSLDTGFTAPTSSSANWPSCCPLIAADGSMVYAISSGGSYSTIEEIANDGSYVGTVADMLGTDNLFISLLGTKTDFLAPATNGNLWAGGAGSGVYPTGFIGGGVQMTVMMSRQPMYSSPNGKVYQTSSPYTAHSLTYVSGTTLRWTQAAGFPAFDHTKFQLSTDGGSTWSDLGFGTKVNSTQIELTGVTLPGSGLVRTISGTKAGIGGLSRSLLSSKTVTITPEIEVTSTNPDFPQLIEDGDTTPEIYDGTDFGSVTVSNGSSFRTYKVNNLGINVLTISSITITGAHAADFSASSLTSVFGQASGNLNVTFDPSGVGTRTATITINSDDADEGSYQFDIQGVGIEPEINVKGNGVNIVDGDTTPSLSDHTDFGNVAWNQTLTRTFTLENPSAYPLSVSLISSGSSNFTISRSYATVAPSSSATFNVTFIPNGLGSRSATITITSNDGDEGSYDFAVQGVGAEPEINLTGNSVNIVDGDTTPSTADHTDFGTPSVGGNVVRTYTIQNTNGSSLTVSAINVTGHSADFTVGGISLPAVVAASSSTTFTVTYAPLTSGLRSATVTLVNNDVDESSYDFAIQGTSSPEINIQGGAASIVDGDTTPSAADGTDFGVAVISTEQVVTSFTIQNLGTGPLSVTGITKSGTHNADYAVSGLTFPRSVASGSSVSFDVTFSPSAIGTRSATIIIANNDANESNYDFAVQGRGVQPGELDTLFNPTASAHTVNAAAVQPDGRMIVVGNFTTMGGTSRVRVARINQDGTLDTSFADPNVNGEVHCVAVQADGKILIGGAFTTVGGTARNRIARLNSDGSLDSYNPNSNGVVYSISVQSDGKAIVTGAFAATSPTASIGGQTRNRVARLDTSGAADSFNPNVSTASSNVYGSVTQADGKVIIYGTFTTVGGTTRNRIARVDSSGALDTGYNPNSASTINCAVLQPNGKLVVGGIFTTTIGGQTRTRLARLETNGNADTGFTATANAEVHGLSLQANGKIIVNGQLTLLNATGREYAGRLNDDGTFDSSFIDPNPSASGYIYGSTLEADGGLVVTGAFTTIGGTARMKIARLENNVSSETLAVTSSSRIEWLRGGAGPEARFVIFELSTDGGSTWSSLGSGTRISGGWEITGLSLPGTGQVRASAYTSSGRRNGSQGIVQSTVVY